MGLWQFFKKVIFFIFIITILVFAILYIIWGDSINLSEIKIYLKNFGIWTSLIFILLFILITIFIPSTPFMVLAGILFGFWYGLLYTIIGGLLSSILVFEISRILGKEWIDKILNKKNAKYINKYNNRLERGALLDLILLRIAPIMPFNVLNILMGISKMGRRNYILGTLIGLAPSNFLSVYIGTFLTKIF